VSSIEVKGIDRDGESRSMTIDNLTPLQLAKDLHDTGWKFARLTRNDQEVGRVELSVPERARVYWGKPE
jgi:hypothetical protein